MKLGPKGGSSRAVETTLHRDFVDQSLAQPDAESWYVAACFLEAILADLWVLERRAGREAAAGRLALGPVRRACVDLAERRWAWKTGPETLDRRLRAKLRDWSAKTWDQVNAWAEHAGWAGDAGPVGGAAVVGFSEALGRWTIPESYAYDVSDPDVCREDARWWADRKVAGGADAEGAEPGAARPPARLRPPLVVGVRTGGSYLAPLWAAALREVYGPSGGDHPYLTVRPVRNEESGAVGADEAELEAVGNQSSAGREIVLVDDQPDTGLTVLGLVRRLRERGLGAAGVWLAAPGRVFRAEGDALVPLREGVPLRAGGRGRLWRVGGKGREREFIEGLRAAGVPLTPRTVEAVPFAGPFTVRYQSGRTPRHWTDPELEGTRPRRVNPRKTPFLLRCRDTGRPLYHAKFIGLGPFGRFQFDRLRSFGSLVAPERWLCDGYLVTAYEADLHPLREVWSDPAGPGPAAGDGRADGPPAADYPAGIKAAVAWYWGRLVETASVPAARDGPARAFRPLFERRLGALAEQLRVGGSPVPRSWIRRYVPATLASVGPSGRVVHSSLPYSHWPWHWQIRTAGGQPDVRRFHVDFGWGGAVCLELEVASFLLEQAVPPGEVESWCGLAAEATGLPVVVEAVLERLAAALLLAVDSWSRRSKLLSGEGRARVLADLGDRAERVELLRRWGGGNG